MCDREIPIKKIHKFAGYSFTNADLALTQIKILKAISYKTENESDDVFGYLQICLQLIKTLLPSDDGCTFNWLSGFCNQVLEMVFFSSEILTTMSIQEVASSVIQTSLIILTKHAGISPVTLRGMSIHVFLHLLVSSITGVDVATVEKQSKRVLKLVLGDHIYSQFRF